uniref:RNA-binding protein n=1 Tax=Meloidogyne hapla TaxID=6305 RepID=A0A1I8BFC5_MELHA
DEIKHSKSVSSNSSMPSDRSGCGGEKVFNT